MTALEKSRRELSELERRYRRLEDESNNYIKGLEEDKVGLQRSIDSLSRENEELSKAQTELRITLQQTKDDGREALG